MQKILQTFGAAYDTPADPLTDLGNDQATQRRVDDREQQFTQALASQLARSPPACTRSTSRSCKGRKVERIIPMDVTPHTIEVPRRSVSGDYVR